MTKRTIQPEEPGDNIDELIQAMAEPDADPADTLPIEPILDQAEPVDAYNPPTGDFPTESLGPSGIALIEAPVSDLAVAIAQVLAASPELLARVEEHYAGLTGHPHVHELMPRPVQAFDSEPRSAAPDSGLFGEGADLIELPHGYRGRLTQEQFLAPGVYAVGDPALRGLEQDLVDRGHARRL